MSVTFAVCSNGQLVAYTLAWALASTYPTGANLQRMLLVFAATLLAGGLGLQFNGIQVFKTGRCNKHIPWLLAGLMFIQNTWFVVLYPTSMAESSLIRCCTHWVTRPCSALFIRVEQPLRTAYWFTGASFAILRRCYWPSDNGF